MLFVFLYSHSVFAVSRRNTYWFPLDSSLFYSCDNTAQPRQLIGGGIWAMSPEQELRSGEVWHQTAQMEAGTGCWELTLGTANMKQKERTQNGIVLKLSELVSSDIFLTRLHPLNLTNDAVNLGPSVQMPENRENISFKQTHHILHIRKLCFYKLMHTWSLFKLLWKESYSKARNQPPHLKKETWNI